MKMIAMHVVSFLLALVLWPLHAFINTWFEIDANIHCRLFPPEEKRAVN